MTPFERRPQLITYPDSLGGSLRALAALMRDGLGEQFAGGVHVLPPFPSSADRGFAPTRYDMVEPRFGTWRDLQAIASAGPLTLDVTVNHLSRLSPEFQDFERHGRSSRHADMFMRPDKVWTSGEVPEADLEAIFLRKPKHPFLDVVIADTGATERVWATFGSDEDHSDQIDLDYRSPLTIERYESWFASLASAGATEVRLDAVGYLTKERGTSCFMVEPQIWEILESFEAMAARHGMTTLPEIHADPEVIEALTSRNHRSYDFILPGLVIHALRTGRADLLVKHLSSLPATTVTTLDSHDGIPVQPDLRGILGIDDLIELVAALERRGANVNRILGAKERGIEFDAHQVNISYLDAAGGIDHLVVARAIQLFSPGRPQVYYQGLLGSGNDVDAVARTGEGRSINRSDFSPDEVDHLLRSEAATRQGRLLELRSTHPTFDARAPHIEQTSAAGFDIRWEHEGNSCRIQVDLDQVRARVRTSPATGHGSTWTA